MELRTAIFSSVQNILRSNKFFGENDFVVTAPERNGKAGLTIVYRFEEKFQFQASLASYQDHFSVKVCPGVLRRADTFNVKGREGLIAAVTEWVVRVQEELEVTPVERRIADQQRQFEAFLDQFEKLPNEYFTRQEADEIKAQLDELRENLVDNIRKSIENEKDAALKVEALQRDVEALKAVVESLKKPSWAGALASRLFDWSKEPANQKILISGAKTAAQIMLHAGDHHNDTPGGQ